MADEDVLKQQDTDATIYPFTVKIKLRGVEIKTSNIQNCIIRESIFDSAPVMELMFTDYGIFTDVFPLTDEDLIEVEISTNKSAEGIKAKFMVLDYGIQPLDVNQASAYLISLTATYNTINLFYPVEYKSYPRKTSSEVLKIILEEIGFKVDNETKTNDTMTWLKASCNNADFLKQILESAYKEEGNTIFAYGTKSGNAYIKDLVTETKKKKKFTIIQTPDPKELYTSQEEVTQLGYSFFRMMFHNGSANAALAYGLEGNFYDYDKAQEESVIQIIKDFHLLTTYSLKRKTALVNNVVENNPMIMKYTNSNVHDNYHMAYLQNKYIRETFFSDMIMIISYFNDEVSLFDKVELQIPSLAKVAEHAEINSIYSGEYMVVGIVNQINSGMEYKSILILSRGGINASGIASKDEIKLNDK